METQTYGQQANRGNGYFRRGDLPVLFLLIVQLVIAAYGYGRLQQRMDHVESEMMRLQYQMDSVSKRP